MRHILGISGGKDSAALAVFLAERQTDWRYFADLMGAWNLADERERIISTRQAPEIEYFFTDTGKELPEVYEFICSLEAQLGKAVLRLKAQGSGAAAPFDHLLIAEHGGLLPSRMQRWCTYKMKLKPMEDFVNGEEAVNYVGIRADEQARVKLSSKPNITAVYPFVSANLARDDIFRILRESVGVPKYYEWRSRSGCFFCFFQRKQEWLGLRERHPDLFRKAMEYEENTYDPKTGRMYTWMDKTSLKDLDASNPPNSQPSRFGDGNGAKNQPKKKWQEIMIENMEDDDPHDHACAICSL